MLLCSVPVSDIIKFANDVTRWMDADDRNVIAVHCKGGKGRTGMMICVWLVHSSEFGEAQVSLSPVLAVTTSNWRIWNILFVAPRFGYFVRNSLTLEHNL